MVVSVCWRVGDDCQPTGAVASLWRAARSPVFGQSGGPPVPAYHHFLMPTRHFVKYTFLKVDPAWRRRDDEQRASDKREFIAACEDFADGHLLRAFSLVGTRGDADMMLLSQAQNLERIHEFHVVLGQSGLMKWCAVPYSYLAMTKPSEYSEESRLEVRS